MSNKIPTFEHTSINDVENEIVPIPSIESGKTTNCIPPTWASEMNKDKPAVMFLDEYRIENRKEWHNGK
jgi:hypothetical protein